jgi:hypothetical protein
VSGGPDRWDRIRAAASAKESIGMSTQDYGQDPDQQSGQLSPDEYGQQGNRFGAGGYQDQMDQMNPTGQGVDQDPNQQQQSGGQSASTPDPYQQQQQQTGQMGQMDQIGQGGSIDPSQQQAGQSGAVPLGGARQQAEQQIDSAIDQFANRVPGGQQGEQPAKDAAHKGLDEIERQAGDQLGGTFGGGNQGG